MTEAEYWIEFERFLEEEFPIKGGQVWLECIPKEEHRIFEENGGMRTCLRVLLWEGKGDSQSLENVMEQEIFLEPIVSLTSERLGLILTAWKEALVIVFGNAKDLDWVMPYEYLHSRLFDVHKLKKAVSREDYVKAFLMKSRLGRILAQ